MQLQWLARLLPKWAQTRWSTHAADYKAEHDDYPTFEGFAEFVTREEEKANDPVFSLNALTSKKPVNPS